MKTKASTEPTTEPKRGLVRVRILRPIVHEGDIRVPPEDEDALPLELDIPQRDVRELIHRGIVEEIDDEPEIEQEDDA